MPSPGHQNVHDELELTAGLPLSPGTPRSGSFCNILLLLLLLNEDVDPAATEPQLGGQAHREPVLAQDGHALVKLCDLEDATQRRNGKLDGKIRVLVAGFCMEYLQLFFYHRCAPRNPVCGSNVPNRLSECASRNAPIHRYTDSSPTPLIPPFPLRESAPTHRTMMMMSSRTMMPAGESAGEATTRTQPQRHRGGGGGWMMMMQGGTQQRPSSAHHKEGGGDNQKRKKPRRSGGRAIVPSPHELRRQPRPPPCRMYVFPRTTAPLPLADPRPAAEEGRSHGGGRTGYDQRGGTATAAGFVTPLLPRPGWDLPHAAPLPLQSSTRKEWGGRATPPSRARCIAVLQGLVPPSLRGQWHPVASIMPRGAQSAGFRNNNKKKESSVRAPPPPPSSAARKASEDCRDAWRRMWAEQARQPLSALAPMLCPRQAPLPLFLSFFFFDEEVPGGIPGRGDPDAPPRHSTTGCVDGCEQGRRKRRRQRTLLSGGRRGGAHRRLLRQRIPPQPRRCAAQPSPRCKADGR